MNLGWLAWEKDQWEQCHSLRNNPFDRDEPNAWVSTLEKEGRIRGSVLDLGCGAGHNALYLAAKGYNVVGIDIASNAIERAKEKAMQRNVRVEFAEGDVSKPLPFDAEFDTVIDIGCFHSLSEEDHANYASTLYRAARPGSTIFLRAFSDFGPVQTVPVNGRTFKAPAVSEKQLRQTFQDGWKIIRLEHKEIQLEELKVVDDVEHRKHVWFAEVKHDSSVAKHDRSR